MSKEAAQLQPVQVGLEKVPTGIRGLDEITEGGVPKGRSALICGSAGCGKTLFGMEFIVRGATEYGEPGVFFAFEETAEELTQNVWSLGFDLKRLVAEKKLRVEHIRVDRSEIEEAGDYDLEGLFIRLGWAIDSIGAKRVVLDTLETLFSGLSNHAILRAELRRLFRWLKDKGVTSIITAEKGAGNLTRHGIEEYVSDCVILLDHRVVEQVSTRRLRVVKYRGGVHGTNEYPFLIDEDGVTVLPVTSLGLQHKASDERVSSGVPRLDAMLGGKGYFRGSSVLVTGPAGTGKTSLGAHFALAACRRGERCLYFSFEESEDQFLRNMRSIGIDLEPFVEQGLFRFRAVRSAHYGLEMHLATIYKIVRDFDPQAVVVDPIDSLASAGGAKEGSVTLVRLVDFLKSRGISAVLNNLTTGGAAAEATGVEISSLVDTWLLLRSSEHNGERNRVLQLLKSRGMAHSNQAREFLLTDDGIELRDVYCGTAGVVTGSARAAQEAHDRAAAIARQEELASKKRELDRKQEALQARIDALRKEFDAEAEEMRRAIGQATTYEEILERERTAMAQRRWADDASHENGGGNGDRP